ncbi:MAG: hypothetical protein LBB05_04390 [Puniceicoccales bacterium]|nr:hypothetical protein [Puniceicoccales bacterium]
MCRKTVVAGFLRRTNNGAIFQHSTYVGGSDEMGKCLFPLENSMNYDPGR